jgi:sec-independent protein translocase protein TatA
MGTFSIWHWLIVLAVVLVLFGGGGKISKLMGDFGKGLKSFKNNIKEEGFGEANGEVDTDPDKAISSKESK